MCLCMLVGLLPTTVFAAWGDGCGGQSQNGVEVAFYYIYTNQVPNPPQDGPTAANYYGPSSNDTPLVKTTVNVDTLFSKLDAENQAKAQSLWNNGKGYITAASCGYTDNATWWGLVVSCMDEAGKNYFTNDSFGKLFQGYVVKYVRDSHTVIHCDGIITEAPPLYLVELEDVTNDAYVGTMSSSTETGNTVSSIQAKFKTHLEAIYDSGTIDWTDSTSGTFTTGNTSYKISLQYTPALTGTLLQYEQIAGVNGGNYYRAIVKMTVKQCYTVTYDANGGTGSVPTDSNLYTGDSGAAIATILYDPIPTRDGYTFLGWDTNSGAQTPSYTQNRIDKQIQVNQNVILYAIWQAMAPDLSVKKTAALVNAGGGTTPLGENGEVTVGDTIRYKVTVINNGGPAENVQVSDSKFPSGGTGVAVTPTGSASRNENGYYTIGSLGVNGSVAFTYDYTVTSDDAAAGSVENTATVTCNSAQADSDSVTVTVKKPETTVTKVAVSVPKNQLDANITWTTSNRTAPEYTPVTLGSDGTRTLTVGNASKVALLYSIYLTAVDTNNVTVTDARATYVGCQSVGNNTVTVTVNPGVDDTYTVTWATEGTTKSPAKAYLYFTKTVTVSESLNKIENTVTVSGDKTATSTVPVYQVKSVSKDVLTSVPQGVTAPQNLANFIQVGGQPTVLIHANAKQVALLYKITVTGTQGATFTVEDNGAVFWGGSAWNGTGTGTIGSSGTYELYCYKTFDKGSAWGTSLSNTATVLGRTDTEETPVATFAKDDDGHHSKYTLYYHSNFGKDQKANEGTDDDKVVVKDYDELKILPERDGYVFVSWNTEEDGSGTRYLPGAVFALTKSENHLYAQWQKEKPGPDDSGVSNWLETDDHKAYLTGYPDSTFRADRNMTRAEVAQMFYALLLDKNVTITKSFSDVPDDAWYSTAVKTLASLGMMDGYPDGTFRPDEPITRAEFATVGLAFAYDPLDASCSYYDVGANAWYYTYVAQATTYGWIGGYPDNTFRPGNNITRVEVCVIVNNMLGRDADERYIDRHEDELVHFVDLSDSYWGYYTIMESTNTHEYTGSFTNEKWTDVK